MNMLFTSWVLILICSCKFLAVAENCEEVDGVRQSPINIDVSKVSYKSAPPFKWSFGYNTIPESMSLIYDGRSLKLRTNSSIPINISGGFLKVPYEFRQLHFHWGDSDDKGSEHKINNISYPMEMHAVHIQSSTNESDQYVVVAYFFRPAIQLNKGLNNLLKVALDAADNIDTPFDVEPFRLSQLVDSRIAASYYTYEGSLTTPPYTESVTWVIASSAVPISRYQMKLFRSAAEIDKGLLNNFRCPQDLNDRRVERVVPYQ